MENEDRISSLPDSLLFHILSFLGDTKETVKTCVLSKRWEFVWTHLLEVELNGLKIKPKDDEKLGRFVDSVGNTLAKCKNLKKVVVFLPYNKRFAANVDNWVYSAIENKVTDISLMMHSTTEYELPQMLYSYSSLSNLSLGSCKLAPSGMISWGSLKSLFFIAVVDLFDSVMENILSNCPELESLTLLGCLGLNYLNIQSPNLIRLTIQNVDYILDVSAPFLLFLTIVVERQNSQFRLTDVSSVVSATIDFNNLFAGNTRIMNQMKYILESLRFVEVLELKHQSVEIISMLEFKSWKLPSFSKLKVLTLNVFDHESSIPGILAILRSSPKLVTLIIEVSQPTDEKKKDLEQYEIRVEDCNLDLEASHMIHVLIKNLTKAEHMLTLVEILLESTKALRMMIINLDASSTSTLTDSKEISKRLLTFRRQSRECAVKIS